MVDFDKNLDVYVQLTYSEIIENAVKDVLKSGDVLLDIKNMIIDNFDIIEVTIKYNTDADNNGVI